MKKIIYKDDKNIRIDQFISNNTSYSRSQASKLISDGMVKKNGSTVSKSSEKIMSNDEIQIAELMPKPNINPIKLNLNVKYEDEDLIILSKDQGIIVHPSDTYKGPTLVSGIIEKYPEISDVGETQRPGIVHRLDKETSGLMVIAKNPKSYQDLKLKFKNRKVTKEYVAIVNGPIKNKGIIEAPIGRHPINKIKRALVETGKDAYTSYEKIDENNNISMIKVNILTGRTHQIRVHLSSIGCPVVGDNLYSNSKNKVHRLFLHSIRIKFNHPSNNKDIEIQDNIPKEFLDLIKLGEING
ncbi:MAG: pseudouridine synthase [Dehalococcoidia bacterium]|nr:pseudouridine synthase [Dehalococcoidia bacterium]MEC9451335.1 RluA family pseudouridine synthase [Chloroflexota bacterium]|tara:strand:+ start:3168 stop:4061 length:894 start_codon:yes stop_codon:yes gene_type:complete